jgi:hypothetical protein
MEERIANDNVTVCINLEWMQIFPLDDFDERYVEWNEVAIEGDGIV